MTDRLPLPPPGARLTLTIDAVDDEGRGRAVVESELGTADGYDVAVRGATVGDRVEAVVERVWAKRRLLQARRTRLLDQGDASADSPCPHGPPCPGCPLEGWHPDAAIAFKMGRLQQALDEVGLDVPLDGPLLGAAWYGRRQRTKLAAAEVKGRMRLGLFAPHSHRLLEAARCPHLRPALTPAIERVRDLLDRARPEARQSLKAVTARTFVEGVAVVLVAEADLPEALWAQIGGLVAQGVLASAALRVDERQGNSVVGGTRTRAAGPQALMPLEGGPPVDIDSFCQPDPDLAVLMVERTAAFLAEAGTEGWALDGYAGAGTFGRALLDRGFSKVVAVESATHHEQALVESTLEPMVTTMQEALGTLAERGPPTAIVVDPPRKGLGDAAVAIAALGAPRLALVSCDPSAMARDLTTLIAAGYQVIRCEPVDLFGGAAAVEALTFLVRPSMSTDGEGNAEAEAPAEKQAPKSARKKAPKRTASKGDEAQAPKADSKKAPAKKAAKKPTAAKPKAQLDLFGNPIDEEG